MISQRANAGGHAGHLAYGAWSEAEDVLASAVGSEIAVLDRHSGQPAIRARRVLGRTIRRFAGRGILLRPTSSSITVDGTDHVFFIAHNPWDLPLLERIRDLRRAGITVSVWMSEIWPSELEDHRISHECYEMIDHVFVGVDEAVAPFAELAPSSQIHVLPPAVDVLRFAPVDPSGPRGIAVLGIGRRDAAQHRELLDWARRNKALYIYDTVSGRAVEWAEHRKSLAGWYQQTGVAICNNAKHDVPELTRGLRVMPGRLFEGLAAGAILVGLPPDEASQRELLGTTVVEPLDGSPGRLSELLDRFRDPAVAMPIRARNMAIACRGHDWGHRWQAMFDAVGLDIPFGLRNRLEDLAKRADELEELADSR